MQRQRKRDLNLKPNRVLDKRSSRGMIYENEELRLRTLAIADDVDRGHNDIRKLRKENEHLKREIWALRDECEKLEEVVKKVVTSGGLNFDPTDLPYPELFLEWNDPSLYDGTSRRPSQEDYTEAMTTMFQEVDTEGNFIVNVETHLPPPPTMDNNQICTYAKFDSDLETLKEESESLKTLNNNSGGNDGRKTPDLPDPSQFSLTELEPPLIQITPASAGALVSPSDQNVSEGDKKNAKSFPEETNANQGQEKREIQEIGWIAVIPPKYETTSSIQISPERRTKGQEHGKSSSHSRHSLHCVPSTVIKYCPSCYQSEPALSSQIQRPSTPTFGYPNFPLSTFRGSGFTGLEEGSLVIGTVTGEEVKSEEIVDSLEASFGHSIIEALKGIRVLGKKIFLSFRTPDFVTTLLEKGQIPCGKTPEEGQLTLKAGTNGAAFLKLSGLSPEISDSEVFATLHKYGQVVGPLERRRYKGVQIWEREVKVHLALTLPRKLTICGFEVSVVCECERDHDLLPSLEPCQHLHISPSSQKEDDDDRNTDPQSAGRNAGDLHKPITRCSSSSPRLSGCPPSPVPPQRQASASICEDSPAGRLFQKNPNLHKTSAAKGQPVTAAAQPPIIVQQQSAPNLTATGKKPLTRLMKSSPGNLVPPNPTAPAPQQEECIQTATTSTQAHTPAPASGGNPFRAAFYRGLSITDPRRGSTASTTLMENNNYLRRNSSFWGRHQPLSQMPSNSSSHESQRENRDVITPRLGKREPLPWCGCWGNGLI